VSEANVDDNQRLEEAVVMAEEKALISGAPSGGDQWMASPAWRKTAESMLPEEIQHIDTLPSTLLELEWVHGYRGYDCRNNVRYLDNDAQSFGYHAAALSIAYTKEKGDAAKKQTFFSEHQDDVISHATFGRVGGDGRCLIATGDIGKKPSIHVYEWTTAGNFKPLASISGFHSAGVCQMTFARDGTTLFTIGVDYSIAIYCTDVSEPNNIGKMICSSKGPKDRVLDCCSLFVPDRNPPSFMSCGEKHISFWSTENKTLVQETVRLSSYKRDFIMCVSPVAGEKQCVAGTSEGHLLYVQSGSLMKEKCIEKLHSKSINSLYSTPDGATLITGGADGKICCIHVDGKLASDVKLLVLSIFNVYGISGSLSAKPRAPPIRSVCISSDSSKILVGTAACEIVEIHATSKTPFAYAGKTTSREMEMKSNALIKNSLEPEKMKEDVMIVGHYKHELWGLAIRPSTPDKKSREYCTVGDDGYLRVWDLATKSLKNIFDMGTGARCCDYSPDGQYLAVGFGSGRTSRRNKHNGAVRIYRADTEDMKQVCELKEAKQWISKVKFSPDGSILAVGSRDNSVYSYSVAQQFKRKSKFSKHNAGILDFDFSTDGKYIQSTCSAYELLFSDHGNGAQLTHGASMLAEEEWDTWTCSLGWPVMGIWDGAMDGSDVNSVDRSKDNKLIAVGDDSGKINVYRYPATLPDKDGAPHHEYLGHSSHVTMVRWVTTPDKKGVDYLISTGGNDKCVFQWKAATDTFITGNKVPKTLDEPEEISNSLLAMGPQGGDEFMAVKPWLGAIHPPMAWSNPDNAKLPPFFAALGEMSALHGSLRQKVEDDNDAESNRPENLIYSVNDRSRPFVDTLSVYKKVVTAADEVFKHMSGSGVKNCSQPDGDELELEWVHGYRGFDCRNNVFYVNHHEHVDSRSIIYHAASLGIEMTIDSDGTRHQRYFRGHDDDITAMAVYTPDAAKTHLVATGQQGKGKTFVWEVPSIKTLAILETKQKTICQIAFANQNGGRALITIGEDQSVAISDWKSQTVLNKTKGDAAVCYHIVSAGASFQFNEFLAVGDKFVTLWSLNGRSLTSKKVRTSQICDKNGRKVKGPGSAKFMCSAQSGSAFYIGCYDGNIYVFSPTSCEGGYSFSDSLFERGKSRKCAVLSLNAASTKNFGDVLLSGCSDGTVTLFKLESECSRSILGSFSIASFLPSIMAKQVYTLSICETAKANIVVSSGATSGAPELSCGVNILVGTRGCDLIEVAVPLMHNGRATSSCSSEPPASLDFSKASIRKGISKDGVDVDNIVDPSQWAGVLLRGHCNNEVWGLACHPLLPEYVTVGDDMSMRCFDVSTRKMKHVTKLGAVARACAYSNDGSLLAIGFGGRFGKGKEPKGGMVRLYRGNHITHECPTDGSLEILAEVRDATQWISDVKFSADTSTLCVAAHDCKIYIYDVTFQAEVMTANDSLPVVGKAVLKLRTTFRKHASVVNHIDISSEGRYMQSNCSAYELLFCDLTTGKQVTHSSQLKDVTWDTWTCIMGWPVQGIWQKGMDGSDINAAARSHTGHLLATADDNGKIHLFRYPVIEEGAGFLTYAGHSSHVTNVRWSAADEVLVSCGGADKCIMQWKHVMNEATGDTGAHQHHAEDEITRGEFESMEIEEFSAGPSGGDESGAVKPWLGAVRAPTHAPSVNREAPAVNMTLSWVHGYTAGKVCNVRMSNNLFYAVDGEPVYPAAACGVRLNRNTNGGAHEQKFFTGHDDDILCLAVSMDRRFVATGQTASHDSKGMGSICIWSSTDCRLLARMDRCHQRGVYSLAFNRDGTELVSVGQDNKNTHKLWCDLGGNWSRVQVTATATSDQSTIYFTHWLHPENTLDCKLISGGSKSMNFWKLEGATLVKKQGRFGRKYKRAPLLCAANIQAKDEKGGKNGWALVAGTSSGDFYVFEDREVSTAVPKAHSGAVLCLAEGNEACSFLVSGGADKTVRVWNQAMQPISSFDMTESNPKLILDTSIAAIDIRPDIANDGDFCLKLLVGTYGGEVFELSAKPQAAGSSKNNQRSLDITSPHVATLVSSHTTGELWGLAVHPTDPDLYCTVGDDATLRIWSLKKQRQLAAHPLGYPARSVAWGPQMPVPGSTDNSEVAAADIIAIGFYDGPDRNKKTSKRQDRKKAFTSKPSGNSRHSALRLYSVDFGKNIDITELAHWDGTDAWISDIKFSPPTKLGGVRLGVACHDAHLYMFNLPDFEMYTEGLKSESCGVEWKSCLDTCAVFKKHSATVTHFDFNIDGTYFQSNCAAGELLFGQTIGEDHDDHDGAVTSITHITRSSRMAEFNGVYDPTPTDDGEDNIANSKWASQTCILGWPVQGIWTPDLDTGDINSCDEMDGLLATGDDFGRVNIYRYPAVAEGSNHLTLTGHSSHVTNVRWTSGEHLISTGGNDNCVFIWHCEKE
jgi:microtubule-associated protein-like 6